MLRLVFSFQVVLVCLLLPLTVFTQRTRFNDPDMWWHLKMGEIIWTNHHVPTVDLFRTQPGTTPGFRMSGYRKRGGGSQIWDATGRAWNLF
jgi:hypothetical protein